LQRGLNGAVQVNGADITRHPWVQQVGLQGEHLRYYTDGGSQRVKWNTTSQINTPMTWYQLSIPTPAAVGDAAYATWTLDMGGMGKGSLWFNGFMVGAYWSIKNNQGQFSQQYYHVPRDYVNPTGQTNNVIVLEESGGNPESVTLIQRNQRPNKPARTVSSS